MDPAILVTKLFVPATRSELVRRPRLTRLMQSGQTGKLTLISAPAGFGKTTVVTEWLGTLDATVAWLSLDKGDNDLARFLTYLITGLCRVGALESSVGAQVIARLLEPQPASAESLLTALVNHLADGFPRVIVVLDDFHVIDAPDVLAAVTYLLDHLPPRLHLVVTTREDPALPLARLRARGQLTELRAADLRFSTDETTQFLVDEMGLALTADDLTALEARTEGWIAGLQLAALSLRGRPDPANLIRSFTGSHRFVLDYLVEEVLNRQTADVQRFLLQTAILDRLSGPLCDRVTGQRNCRDTLEALDRANLFIVPLDAERHWYRYHHLFADLLLQRLHQSHPDRVPELHARASAWYAEQNLMPEAIHHARAAGADARVAELAERAWPDWSVGHRAIVWLGWVSPLPVDLIRDRPVLSAAAALAHLAGGDLEAAEAQLTVAERRLELVAMDPSATAPIVADANQYRGLPARLAMTRAYLAQARGDAPATLRYVDRTLDLLPANDDASRATATSLKGLAHWTQGDLGAAYDVFSKGLSLNDENIITGTFVLADMQMALGHLRQAESVCERGLALSRRLGPPSPVGTETIHTALSHIHREQGDLDAAARDLDTARALGEQIDLPDWKHRWFIAQARLKESQGELDQALELLDTAARHHVRTPVPDVRPITALKARILVKAGQVVEARQWAHDLGLSADDSPSYFREFEHVTLARIFIAESQLDRDPSKLHAAHDLLDNLASSAEAAGRLGSLIEILVMKTLAFEAQTNLPAALKPLCKALELAEPEGFVRVFVDEGPPMAHLLYAALAAGHSPSYVQRLLEAFPEMKRRPVNVAAETRPEGLEPLSDRERDVLQLIAEGLSNQDIGDRLFLALNTVKAHTRSIYGKLGVNSRTQAIVRARALGVLDSN